MQESNVLINRLIDILIRLYNKERFSIANLANDYNVSERTIYRDLKRLERLDIKKDANDRYYLQDNKILKSYQNELSRLLFSITGEQFFSAQMIEKIINLKYFPIKFQPFCKIYDMSNFTLLCDAIIEQKIIRANYNSKPRILRPYKIISHQGVWYLLASENSDIKTFALYKLKTLSISDESFTHDEKILEKLQKDEDFFISNYPKIEVILEIKAAAMDYFLNRKILANQSIIDKSERALILSTLVEYTDELFVAINSFIPNVKILSPSELAQKHKKIIKSYLNYLK